MNRCNEDIYFCNLVDDYKKRNEQEGIVKNVSGRKEVEYTLSKLYENETRA